MKIKTYITMFLLLMIASPIFSQDLHWETLPDMPVPRVGHCAVVFNDRIWIIGGKNQLNHSLKTVDCFNLKSRTWESGVAELKHTRFNAAAVVYDNKIFVIGGHNNRQILSSVEYYDSTYKEWKEFTPLIYPREGATAVVFKDRMYVIGGVTNKGFIPPPIDIVEYWDSSARNWQESTEWRLVTPRVFMQSVVFDQYVYTIGGLWFDDQLDLVERFGFDMGTEPVNPLPTPKFYFSAVRLDQYIYVLGGISPDSFGAFDDTTVYYYSPQLDQWNEASFAMTSPRAGLCAVTYKNDVYVFGGMDANFEILATAEQLKGSQTSIVNRDNPNFLPTEHRLVANYPNPFNSLTTITFELARQSSQLLLVIFNVKGEAVRSFRLNSLPPGTHQIQWDGRDEQGRVVESGIYLAQLRSDHYNSRVLKLSFIK